MKDAAWRVLLIDDDEEDAILTRQMLASARQDRFSFEWAATAAAGLAAMRERSFDAVLVDYQLGEINGTDLIRRCVSEGCPTPLILLTGWGSYDIDLAAMQAGAEDYLPKQDLTPALLERSIRYAIERKRSANELRQHEAVLARERELLQVLFDSIPVMIVMFRPDLGRVQFNQTFERLTGWTTAEGQALKEAVLEKMYPDPLQRQTAAGFFLQAQPGWQTFEIHTRGGELLPSRWSNVRLADQTQIGIGIDIREELRAAQALRSSEERFRLASQAVAGIVYDWDLVAGRVQHSEAINWILGVSPEIPARDPNWWLEQIHPGDRPHVLARFGELLAGAESAYEMEYRARHADGHWVHIWDRALIVRDAQGRPVRIIGTMSDISARKELELALAQANASLMEANQELSLANLALRENEGRFRIALENAPVTVFTHDCDLRYTWIYNPPAGLEPDQFLGRRDDELFSSTPANELLEAKRTALRTGEPLQREVTAQVDGQTVTYLLTLEPLVDDSGRVAGLRGAGVDLTELRRLEAERLERATQLELHHRLFEQREMERQRIARDLHDGPIQELLGMIFAIHGALAEPPAPAGGDDWSLPAAEAPAARLQQLETALKSTREAIQKLVGDLRVLCNELRPPALVQLGLEQAIRSHAEALHLKNPELAVHLDLPRGARPLPDPLRLALFRIYQEAMNNILRHSRAGEVYVRLVVGEQEAALEIIDDGQGFAMPDNWLELAREGHLGLVGMKERAEAAGGSFSITAQPGRGARVRASVPLP